VGLTGLLRPTSFEVWLGKGDRMFALESSRKFRLLPSLSRYVQTRPDLSRSVQVCPGATLWNTLESAAW
jgi:hypothetical protein